VDHQVRAIALPDAQQLPHLAEVVAGPAPSGRKTLPAYYAAAVI